MPKVSVIIPVHDTVDYLESCVNSAARQTIGADQLEIIAIDDGSTDGSGDELDRLATRIPILKVIHQEASGGPSHPRNVGLDHATGDYVFFLDSDDRLGDEALERMVTMAERNDSDIVLGKWVSPEGRKLAQSMFRYSQAHADLFTSDVYDTLSPLKLFRRSLIGDMRFPEDMRIGEDQPFVATAYLTAKVISVVADYTCYYATRRDDGSSVTQRGADYFERLPQTEQVIELIAAHTDPGPGRDRLVGRHIRGEVLKRFNKRFLAMEPAERERLTSEIKKVLDTWTTDLIARRLTVRDRLRAYCVQHDLSDELLEIVRSQVANEKPAKVTENGRTYQAFPYFRQGPIPDEVYESTLHEPVQHRLDAVAYDDGVITLRGSASWGPDEQSVEMVLRERSTGVEYRTPADRDFEFRVAPATAATGRPLAPGLWDVSVAVTTRGISKETRFGRDRGPGFSPTAETWRTPEPVDVYYTKPHGNITFDVGQTRVRPPGALEVDGLSWAGTATALIKGRLGPDMPAADVHARLTGPGEHTFTADPLGDHGFAITIPLRALNPGHWSVTVERPDGPPARLPYRDGMAPTRWLRSGRVFSAGTVAEAGALAVQITRLKAGAVARRLFGQRRP